MKDKRETAGAGPVDLSALGYNDCIRLLKDFKASGDSGLTALRIAILRSYTMEMLEPPLTLRLLMEGYRPEFYIGGFNTYTQEILDGNSPLYRFNPHIVVVMARLEELLPGLADDFASQSRSHWMNEAEAAAKRLAALADRVSSRLGARSLFQNAAPPPTPYWGVYDAQHMDGQAYVVEDFNRVLAREFSRRMNAFIWDFNGFVRAHGYRNLLDAKNWYTARSPYKQSSYPAMADNLTRHLLAMMGRVKKCIVLDLDNTLWGGVAGEDGLPGVALGPEYPGNCYVDFQKGLKRLYDRGIILAINSKNNEADALEIIDRHPHMVLGREHFAAMRINWQDKVSNMKALACDLNIGLDSMIFIDDSPMECAIVRENCPGVDVIQLPERPYLIPGVVDRLPCTENISITEEDRKKGEMYRARAKRKECEQAFDNLEDFLAHLEMEVEIRPADGFSIPRIAQLTQKTNQMNLTTRRYSEADIGGFVESPAWRVFSVSVRDRFGDSGIVGVFILKIDGRECKIDTFLLSCRVIGRNIEQAMLAFIADLARAEGFETLRGEYIPTAKNRPAAGMYERFGFRKSGDGLFFTDPWDCDLRTPPYIKLSPGAMERASLDCPENSDITGVERP